MVLGIGVIRYSAVGRVLALLCVLSCAPGAASRDEQPRASKRDKTLPAENRRAMTLTTSTGVVSLAQRAGECQVIVHPADSSSISRTLPTDLLWPCSFHLGLDGSIRTRSLSGVTYAIVESSRRTSTTDCETFLRALRVNGSSVELSKHRSRLAACPPFQWDAQLYTELF